MLYTTSYVPIQRTTYNVQRTVVLYSTTSTVQYDRREVSTRELDLWMDCGNEKS